MHVLSSALFLTVLSATPGACREDDFHSSSAFNDHALDEVAALQIQVLSSKSVTSPDPEMAAEVEKPKIGTTLAGTSQMMFGAHVHLTFVVIAVVVAASLFMVIREMFISNHSSVMWGGVMRVSHEGHLGVDGRMAGLGLKKNVEHSDPDLAIATPSNCETTLMQQKVKDVAELPLASEDKGHGSIRVITGVLLVVLSSVFFSWSAVLADVNSSSIPAIEIAFIRAICSLIFGSLLAHGVYGQGVLPFQAESDVMLPLLFRGFTDFAASNIFYFACTQVGLGLSTVILFTNPFFAAILANVWLGEPYGLAHFFATLVALTGVGLSALPNFSGSMSGEAVSHLIVMFVFVASLLQAATYCLIKRLADEVHFMQMTVSYGLSGTLMGPAIMTYGMVSNNSLTLPEVSLMAPRSVFKHPEVILMSFLVAMFAILGQIFLNIGCARIPAAFTAAIRTLDVPLALILQFFILGRPATLLEIVGASLVVVACMSLTVVKANCREDRVRSSRLSAGT